VNADVTVLAEAPRVAAHRGAMAANLAEDLNVAPSAINIKATTTERLGFIGRKEGLAALASVLLAACGPSLTTSVPVTPTPGPPAPGALGLTGTPGWAGTLILPETPGLRGAGIVLAAPPRSTAPPRWSR